MKITHLGVHIGIDWICMARVVGSLMDINVVGVYLDHKSFLPSTIAWPSRFYGMNEQYFLLALESILYMHVRTSGSKVRLYYIVMTSRLHSV